MIFTMHSLSTIAPLPPTNEPPLDLSVVIVTHRTPTDVRNCLVTLTTGGGMRGLQSEIIVIDNASSDGTAEMIRADFPQVRLIANDENQGFSRGNNQGIQAGRGRNILLLNPDTLVPNGALAECVDFLEQQDEKVAAMTCRVQSVDGTYQWTASRRFITPWSECCRALLLDRAFKNSDFFQPRTRCPLGPRGHTPGRMPARRVYAHSPPRAGRDRRLGRALFPDVRGRRLV